MAKGVMFSPAAAARIKASVRKTEGALRTQTETQRGQILGSKTLIGKLDADLDYDDTTGVTVSIYSDPETDSGTNKEGVLPCPWMTSGTINSGSWVEVFAWGGEWYADRVVASGTMKVTTLSADLSAGSSATTAAGITVYDELMATGESIGSGTKVYAMLADDGKWYVIAAPCEDA